MSAPNLADVLARAATLGAYRGCDTHERHHGLTYRAVMEWTGPFAIVAVVKAAVAAGAIHGPDPAEALDGEGCRAVSGCTVQEHYAALDLLDAADEIIDDWCIPDRAAAVGVVGARCRAAGRVRRLPDRRARRVRRHYALVNGAGR